MIILLEWLDLLTEYIMDFVWGYWMSCAKKVERLDGFRDKFEDFVALFGGKLVLWRLWIWGYIAYFEVITSNLEVSLQILKFGSEFWGYVAKLWILVWTLRLCWIF